jgi:endonuclease G
MADKSLTRLHRHFLSLFRESSNPKIMIKKKLFILFLFPIIFLSGQTPSSGISHQQQGSYPFEVPAIKPGETVITHTGYSVSYNGKYMDADWVAYELTSEKTNSVVQRSNKFVPDPDVPGGTATNQDYKDSGYDRGHLAPAADMSWSAKSMKESFYFSNICPKEKSFNRGIWKKLEEQVRNWAREYGDIYIVTGPVLSQGLKTIGENHVAVPVYFFKVIVDKAPHEMKGIGFIMQNEASSEPLQHFAVTIDSVEKVTGINFFPSLTKDQEKIIESGKDLNEWGWGKPGE